MHFRGTSNRIRNGRKRRGAKTTCGTPMLYKESQKNISGLQRLKGSLKQAQGYRTALQTIWY